MSNQTAERTQALVDLLRPFVADLPDDLRGDWRFTNHYELTHATADGAQADASFWWLDLSDFSNSTGHHCESKQGQRLGLLLDLAEALSKAKREGLI